MIQSKSYQSKLMQNNSTELSSYLFNNPPTFLRSSVWERGMEVKDRKFEGRGADAGVG